MEKIEFKYRLDESTKELIELAQPLVSNLISTNVKYLIEPNMSENSGYLNERESNKLKELKQLKGQLFNSQEVVGLLNDSNLVPLWINTEIFRSTRKKTIIKLICSRRLKEEKDLNGDVDGFPPFHLLVSLPPWQKDGVRFNINWRHQILLQKWHFLIWNCKRRLRSCFKII